MHEVPRELIGRTIKLRPGDILVKIGENEYGTVSRARLDQWALARAEQLREAANSIKKAADYAKPT